MVLLPSPATGSLLRPLRRLWGLEHTNMATFDPPPVPTRSLPHRGPSRGAPRPGTVRVPDSCRRAAPLLSSCLSPFGLDNKAALCRWEAARLLSRAGRPGGWRRNSPLPRAGLPARASEARRATAAVPRCCGGGACGSSPPRAAGVAGPAVGLASLEASLGTVYCP